MLILPIYPILLWVVSFASGMLYNILFIDRIYHRMCCPIFSVLFNDSPDIAPLFYDHHSEVLFCYFLNFLILANVDLSRHTLVSSLSQWVA